MKNSKLFTLLFFAVMFFYGTTLQSAQVIDGRQKRNISGFHGISVSSGIDLQLTQKNTEEVFVEADSENLDKIITQVENGILKIYIRDKTWPILFWKNQPRKVFVSFKNLDHLNASAGSDVNSESVLKLNNLKVDVSSGSEVKLELEASEVRVETSSGSEVSLRGKADVFQADASSGSEIDADDFECQKCTASASSGSDIRVNVSRELDAHASSGGDISYSGNPRTKNIRESSGGDISGR